MATDWTVIIPVKGTSSAKSRLNAPADLALAIALDTIDAAAAAPGVARVVVVTSAAASLVVVSRPAASLPPGVQDVGDRASAGISTVLHNESEPARKPGVARAPVSVVQDTGAGLNAAIRAVLHNGGFCEGDDGARDTSRHEPGAVAVLLGDLPALRPNELGAALRAAERHERAMVPDAAGTGTTLITSLRGECHSPAFGPGSRAAHRAAGYVEVDLPRSSGLRSDVDTREDLSALAERLGPWTRAALTTHRLASGG